MTPFLFPVPHKQQEGQADCLAACAAMLLLIQNPLIVPVQAGEFPHFDEPTDHAVVLVGLDEQYIYINDPSLNEGAFPVLKGGFRLAWIEKHEQYAHLTPK